MSFVIMSRLRDFAVRLVNLFRRERLERELDAELQAYLELEVQENIRRGMAPKDAKDSDGYKVVNCTRAQPVFHRFGRLARSKVISVTVLRTVMDIKLSTAPGRSPFPTVSGAWHVAR